MGVEDYPGTLSDFERLFATEADCRAYLARMRWPGGYRCLRCSASRYWMTREGLLKCSQCSYKASATVGTIFHRSHLSLRTWFRAMLTTDGWEGYSGLKKLGYKHKERVISGSGKTASALLPRVHRIASLLKQWLLGTHQGAVSPEHLDYYLDEYTFRFNRRTSRHRGKLFYRLVEQAAAVGRTPYARLVAAASPNG